MRELKVGDMVKIKEYDTDKIPGGWVFEMIDDMGKIKEVKAIEYLQDDIVVYKLSNGYSYQANEIRPDYEALKIEKLFEEQGLGMRTFSTGATRNDDSNQLDLEAYRSPITDIVFGQYMKKHALQADGSMRAGDNWQKGIPTVSGLKSENRHHHDVWLEARGYDSRDGVLEGLCGLKFNVDLMIKNLYDALPRGMDLFAKENQAFINDTFRKLLKESKYDK